MNKKLIIAVPIAVVLILSILLTNFLVSIEERVFIKQSQKIENRMIEEQKSSVKNNINNIIHSLEYRAKTFRAMQKSIIQERISYALKIINNIYKKTKDLPEDEIFSKIKEQLSFLSSTDKSKYYFVYKLDGTCMSVPINQKMEGKNFIDLRDVKGQHIIKDSIEIAKNGGGFYEWYFINPNTKSIEKKIGYVAIFEPLNIFIGTAIYDNDISDSIESYSGSILSEFRTASGGYIFAYDKSGKTIAHIKKDLIGTNRWNLHKNGRYLVQEIVNKGQVDGGSFMIYEATINPKTELSTKKISYLNEFKELGWIIGTGFYTDELYNDVKTSQDILQSEFNEELKRIVISSIILTSIGIIILWFIFNKLLKSVASYKKRLEINNAEIKTLNSTLEEQIEQEIEKNKQQQIVLFQQSRLAQMGELIAMIAHQWRQPLAAISSASGAITIKAQLDSLDTKTAIKLSDNISSYSQHLSTTIDDFRDFFKIDKKIVSTTYTQIVDSILGIIANSIESQDIDIEKHLNSTEVFDTYANEIRQVVLNLIKNSEDALIVKNIKNPKIVISTDGDTLIISDNAGGISEDIINSVFDPYFSTKLEKDGSGLGLYMSKTIIEKHCGGEISVHNDSKGAVFEIKLPIAKQEDK